MEDVMANTILKELRAFREENNKKWEENDKRWEQNERRWEENNKKWEQNEICWKDNDKILAEINERLTNVENGREKDRRDILDVLDTMQKTITEQFEEIKVHYDTKIDAIYVVQRVNEIEHTQFREYMHRHEHRLDFYNSRINNLEQWKDQMDLGQYEVV